VENSVLVLPAFEPAPALVDLVERLAGSFRGVVVVDDGSVRTHSVFDALPPQVRLLRHPENRGKGAALKTAFADVLSRFPDATGVVTADADGQHLPEDVLRIARSLAEHPDRLSLGVRRFGADVPFRSRLGNLWTLGEFRLLTGRSVGDTQSGLRGIPLSWLPALLRTAGTRYDYEIAMLVKAAVTLGGVVRVPIATVYDGNNGTSHFRPLADTLSTQKALFAAVLAERF